MNLPRTFSSSSLEAQTSLVSSIRREREARKERVVSARKTRIASDFKSDRTSPDMGNRKIPKLSKMSVEQRKAYYTKMLEELNPGG